MSSTPTLGRIVLYRLADTDISYIRSLAAATTPRAPIAELHEGDTMPAVVVRVHQGDLLNLRIILDGQVTPWVTSRPAGTERGTWSWPSRTPAPDAADLARIGFLAYAAHTEGQTWDGWEMPVWDDVGSRVQGAWAAAAAAISRAAGGGER
ncbi:hypothetical protein [Streptomyces albipurpureus]|uniref:Uncharacterized protein n=1 Tax=Streptomyces albipurpureus TaxID=2897419 RepID=A0ABT0URF5_9ACTN|nr:hypothetical protein [Streptomyces sp. CWNU-1]MCM2390205.1 hypothetical protein [Streptomyces sp. CWNU-1]